METVTLREGDSFIRLGQALKKAGIADSGAEAAALIAAGSVRVNGETETRRGRKLYDGDSFVYGARQVQITA
ncbi:MAG: RNA-binding S4 domain-containing protein [Lachnospiraceae bacterium]|nr:RNA-binding S4 domain-containing protein [Lachnospiraceae bacterium]